jgi:iron complex transport system substrate-binding protein
MRKHLGAASARLVARIIAVCTFALLIGAACQSGQSSSTPQEGGTFPVVIHQSDGSSVTLDRQPRRIVSLSPTATEMLYAIGAGKQVVAVDDQSNYPASAPITKLSGTQPNVEAIAGYSPDLVVAADDTGGLVKGLAAVRVPTLLEKAAKDLNESYSQIRQLGSATGHVAQATDLVSRMRSEVASVVASAGKAGQPLTVYHELDDTFYSATSRTFIGQMYVLFGLRNIADRASGAAPDYPQLSSEFIISSSPDLIVLADSKCCHQSLGTVGARPGWRSIAAVKNQQVVGVDDDVASRWGPRVVDFLRQVAPRVSHLRQVGATPRAA